VWVWLWVWVWVGGGWGGVACVVVWGVGCGGKVVGVVMMS
jgi:hypothetical protein